MYIVNFSFDKAEKNAEAGDPVSKIYLMEMRKRDIDADIMELSEDLTDADKQQLDNLRNGVIRKALRGSSDFATMQSFADGMLPSNMNSRLQGLDDISENHPETVDKIYDLELSKKDIDADIELCKKDCDEWDIGRMNSMYEVLKKRDAIVARNHRWLMQNISSDYDGPFFD